MDSDAVVTIQVAWPHLVGSSNTPYRFHVWVRGYAKKLRLKINETSYEYAFSLRADSSGNPLWTEIWTPPIEYDHEFELRPRIEISPNEVDRTAELWLGAAEVVRAPVEGEWVPHDQPPSTEHFDYEGLTFGGEWTHFFSTVLLSGTDDLGDTGQNYIRTYDLPLVGQAELYFDCVHKQFKLSVNGVESAASAPRALLGGTRVYFGLRQLQGALDLFISDGFGIEHVHGSPSLSLVGRGSIRSGKPRSDSVAAQVYLEDIWYEGCAVKDVDIEEVFSKARLAP